MATWYGIPGIEFIWNGTQSDATLRYKGVTINSTIIEDSMWSDYSEECEDNHIQTNDDDFSQYMKDHADTVYGLLDMVITAERYDYVRGEIDELKTRLNAMLDDLNDSEDESDTEDKETLYQVVGDHIDDLIEDAKKLQKYIREE